MKRVDFNGTVHVFPDEASEDMILEALGVYQGPTVDTAGTYATDVVKSIIRGAAQVPLQVPRFVGAVGDYIREKVGDEQGRVWGDIGTQPGSAFTTASESVDRWIQDTIPPSEFGKTGFLRRSVPEGVGQFIPMVGSGLAAAALTKGSRAAAAGAGAATIGFFSETMDTFDRELERQASAGEERNPDKAFAKAIGYGTISAAIEGQFGAGRIARKLGAESIARFAEKGVSQNALLRFAGRVGKEGAVGTLQEGSQRAVQDLIVEGKLSPEDIGYEAAVGGVVQGLFGIPVAMSQRRGDGIPEPGQVEKDIETSSETEPPTGAEAAPTGGPGERFAATITPEEARQEAEITPELAAQMALDPRLSGTPASPGEVARIGIRRGVKEFVDPSVLDEQGRWIPAGSSVEERSEAPIRLGVQLQKSGTEFVSNAETPGLLRTAEQRVAARPLPPEPNAIEKRVESPRPLSATVLPVSSQTPTPESFESIDDILEFRKKRLAEEVALYEKEIGLTHDEAITLQALISDERSTKAFENRIGPEKASKLVEFFEESEYNKVGGPFEFWETDTRLNPNDVRNETDKDILASTLVSAVQRGVETKVSSDRFLSAAIAAQRLKEEGGTLSDIARYLDAYTTRESSSQGDKLEFFKTIGGRINAFLASIGITLPQGDFASKQKATPSPKPLSEPTVLPLAAAEAATPEEGLAPPGPSSVEAVPAAGPEITAAAALPPAMLEQGIEQQESQAQEVPLTADLYHGSHGKLATLQPGTMLTDDPGWAAGYTTRTEMSGEDTFVGTVHKASVKSTKPIIVKSLHDAEAKLLELADVTGKQYSRLSDAAKLVHESTGADAIVAIRDGKVVGAIPLTEVTVDSELDPISAVEKSKSLGKQIASNIEAAYNKAYEKTKQEGGAEPRVGGTGEQTIRSVSGEQGQLQGVQGATTPPAPLTAPAEQPSEEAKDAVQPIVEEVRVALQQAGIPLHRFKVFGSVRRGTSTSKSDVDIAITVPPEFRNQADTILGSMAWQDSVKSKHGRFPDIHVKNSTRKSEGGVSIEEEVQGQEAVAPVTPAPAAPAVPSTQTAQEGRFNAALERTITFKDPKTGKQLKGSVREAVDRAISAGWSGVITSEGPALVGPDMKGWGKKQIGEYGLQYALEQSEKKSTAEQTAAEKVKESKKNVAYDEYGIEWILSGNLVKGKIDPDGLYTVSDPSGGNTKVVSGVEASKLYHDINPKDSLSISEMGPDILKQESGVFPEGQKVAFHRQWWERTGYRVNNGVRQLRITREGKSRWIPLDVLNRYREQLRENYNISSKKSLADRIRSKKIKDPNLYDATLGIPVAAWNGLVEAVALAVQAGVAIRDAVAKAINDYKERNPNSKIDDVRIAAELTRQVTPITQVPGERTVTKRFEASPDLSVEVKERLTNKLYRVLHQKDAEAVLDEIVKTIPSVDSLIQLYRDTSGQIPDWLRVMFGGQIISELVTQELSAEKAGDKALAEQLRTQQSNFINEYATLGTDLGQAVNAFKWVYKMTPAGVLAWAVRTVNEAAGVDISTYRDLLDKVHQVLADSFKSSRTDITRHKDVTKWLNAWIDRQLHDDAEVQAAAKKAGVTSAQLFNWIKVARNANRQRTKLPDNATDLEKLLRAKVPLAIVKVQQGIATARAKEGPLGEELAAVLGMSDTDAAAFSKLIKNLQGALENDRNKRKIAAFLKTLDKKLPVRVEEIVKKIIAAEGLGALNNAQWQEKLRQMFSAKKLTPDKQSELGKLAEDMHKIPEDQANRKARAYQKLLNEVATLTENWWDLPMAVWYANMLSGVTTQYLNTVSTGLNTVGEWLTSMRGGPGQFLTATRALAKALPAAFQEAAHTMRTGEVSTLRVLRVEPGRPLERDLKGWKSIAKPLKYVTRFMAAQDLLFFVPLMHMKEAMLTRSFMLKEGMSKDKARQAAIEQVFGTEKLRSDAAVQAASEGYTGIEAKRRVTEIVQAQVDTAIREVAAEFGRRGTFNQLHGYGMMGALVRGVNSVLREVPPARFIVPFVNVIGNVVNEGLNYTPIGTARAASSWIKYRYMNPKGGNLMLYGDTATLEDVKDLTFKSMAATVLLGALLVAAAESIDGDGNDDGEGFAIFGFGPRDPSKRDTWRAEGKIPFSMRINGRYYNYSNSPIGIPLATIGNYLDAIRYKDLDANTALERAYYLLGASKDVILQQSFLDGVATILNTKDNISPTKSLEQTLKSATRSLATFVIPNAVRQADNLFDPTIYKPEDVQGMILQSIPFARRLGKPAVNGLGEQVSYPLSARFTRAQSPDPVWRELGRLNVGVYPGQMVHQGERLDQNQLARVAELSGPRIRTMIERVMANPRWSELPDEAEGNRPDKKKVLQRIIEQQRTQAKKRVMSGS